MSASNSTTTSDYTVALIYLYAFLWVSLAVYLAAFAAEDDVVAVHATTAVLLVAILLNLLASTASSVTASFRSFGVVILLAFPTTLLLIHRTQTPYLYFAYLVLHATVAAYVVDVYAAEPPNVPRWLAAIQVGYLVVVVLDTLGRLFPRLLYPSADLQFLTALHSLADIRLLLLFPIIVAWVVIAIVRSRRDGSFDSVPVVWRTDRSVTLALLHVPARFAAAVGTFLAIVARRIGRDFLHAFRFHALHFAKYAATVAAVATMLLGARAFAPLLIKYLRTPTPLADYLEPTRIAFVTVTPLVGFAIFLTVPFLNATLAAMWRPELSRPRLRERAYQIAVVAAVPCALIGPVFWLASRWFDLPGFDRFGVVSSVVLVLVGVMLLLSGRVAAVQVSAPDEAKLLVSAAQPSRDWSRAWPIALTGGVIIVAVLSVGYLPEYLGERSRRSPSAGPTTPRRPPRQLEPPAAALADQQVVETGNLRRGEWRHYWVDVGAGVAALQVTAKSAGGANLYTRYASKVVPTQYSCRATGADTKECTAVTPAPGRWWIALNADSAPASPVVSVDLYYSIQGNAGSSRAVVKLARATAPVPSSVEQAEATSEESGTYVFSRVKAGSYVVTPTKFDCTFDPPSRNVVVGQSTISADFTASCSYSELSNGVTVSAERVAYGAWRYYIISVPEGAVRLVVTMSANTDLDLYTNRGTKPTTGRNNCSSASGSHSERCVHRSPAAGIWWIGVQGYRTGTFSITATYEMSPQPSR